MLQKLNWTFATGLLLAAISLTFSATGLTHLFAGAGIAIPLMAIAFELAKVTGTVWLMRNPLRGILPWTLGASILLLSLISSLGIYGYLGRSYASTRTSLVESASLSNSYTADVERLQKEKDRLLAQIEAIPAEQGTNRRLLTRTLQPQLVALESSIEGKRDSLRRVSTSNSIQENDIGELKFAAELLGTTQDGIAKLVITILAFLLDPLAVMLVMASGVKGQRRTFWQSLSPEQKEVALATSFEASGPTREAAVAMENPQPETEEIVYDLDLSGRSHAAALLTEEQVRAEIEGAPEPMPEPSLTLTPHVIEAGATATMTRKSPRSVRSRRGGVQRVLDAVSEGANVKVKTANQRR